MSITTAIAAWNSLPCKLLWTMEPPEVSGYYWWMCEQEQPDNAVMVNVTIPEDGGAVWMFIYGERPEFHSCEKCQWAGPIPMPMEQQP